MNKPKLEHNKVIHQINRSKPNLKYKLKKKKLKMIPNTKSHINLLKKKRIAPPILNHINKLSIKKRRRVNEKVKNLHSKEKNYASQIETHKTN